MLGAKEFAQYLEDVTTIEDWLDKIYKQKGEDEAKEAAAAAEKQKNSGAPAESETEDVTPENLTSMTIITSEERETEEMMESQAEQEPAAAGESLDGGTAMDVE